MDINTLAFKIVQQSLGEQPKPKKTPANAKGGKARAAVLTPEKRTAIAKKAATSRWART